MYLKFAWKNWLIKISILTSIFLFFVSLILTIFTYSVLKTGSGAETISAVLHSTIYFGVDMLTAPQYLFLIPFAGLIFFGLNLFVADRLWKISFFYTNAILFCTVLIEFFVVLASFSLLRWNI